MIPARIEALKRCRHADAEGLLEGFCFGAPLGSGAGLFCGRLTLPAPSAMVESAPAAAPNHGMSAKATSGSCLASAKV
eukprot:6455078-Amphidinium_carterae.3